VSNWRRAQRTDENQPEIVKQLRTIPGVRVQTGHDDILVGYRGRTYWYEIKDPKKLFNADGSIKEKEIKPSQRKLEADFTGHYKIVWTLDMILEDMGIKSKYPRK
jgi:hypothetical protein